MTTSDATVDALVARSACRRARRRRALADALSGRDADERAARVVPHAEMVDGGGALDAWQRTANRRRSRRAGPVMKGEMFEIQ